MSTTSYENKNVGLTSGWSTYECGWGDAVNQNFLVLDTLVQAQSKGFAKEPPENNEIGDAYLVDSESTGLFAGHENSLAIYDMTNKFVFVTPKNGWKVFNQTDKKYYRYLDNKWQPASSEQTYIGTSDSESLDEVKIVKTSSGNVGLDKGTIVCVSFKNPNLNASMYLNIDNTANIPVKANGLTRIPADLITNNIYYGFIYDGEFWQLIDDRFRVRSYIYVDDNGDYVLDADSGGTGFVALSPDQDIVIG